jgi:hypothetical protein
LKIDATVTNVVAMPRAKSFPPVVADAIKVNADICYANIIRNPGGYKRTTSRKYNRQS